MKFSKIMENDQLTSDDINLSAVKESLDKIVNLYEAIYDDLELKENKKKLRNIIDEILSIRNLI